MAEIAHDSEVWPELIDLERLTQWMDDQELGAGAIEKPQPLGGGTQNILLKFMRAGRPYVLRRPPRAPRPESDEIMRREMRVLAALAGSDVPHPGFIAGEGNPAVLGTAFYLMEPVEGFNATEGMPPLHAGDRAVRQQMGEALVDGAIALSRVDPDAVGLATLGKLDGWIERQVPRWLGQLESYAKFQGWPGISQLPGVETITGWLEANRPVTMQPGLIHGDYHIANVMFRKDGSALAAIVDWELSTLGDPLIDLGWLTATWPDPGEEKTHIAVEPSSGFPSLKQLVARYLDASGRSAEDARWYSVLAPFKLGAIQEGSYARACAGLAPHAMGEALHAHTVDLFRRALRRIDNPIL